MTKYVRIFIIVFIGYFVGDSVYNEMTKDKTPGKAKRLECQKQVTVFERSYSLSDLKYAQKLIAHGNDSFTSYIEKAVYSDSVLFNYISLEQIDDIFRKTLQSYIKYNENNQNAYKLSYYIYENDKNDPGKKTEKSKLYAGYIVLEIKNLDNKSIYKVQVDFMDDKGADIKRSIQCSIRSLMTYNK